MFGLDIRKFGSPAWDIHIRQLLHLLCGHTGTPDRIRSGHETDRRSHRFAGSIAALKNPFERPAVFSAVGPEPPAFRGLANQFTKKNSGCAATKVRKPVLIQCAK
jgi:hypothetical protein